MTLMKYIKTCSVLLRPGFRPLILYLVLQWFCMWCYSAGAKYFTVLCHVVVKSCWMLLLCSVLVPFTLSYLF